MKTFPAERIIQVEKKQKKQIEFEKMLAVFKIATIYMDAVRDQSRYSHTKIITERTERKVK